MPVAIGKSPQQTTGTTTRDLRRFGGVPGGAAATATTAALQALVDSGGVPSIPGDPDGYYVNGPIWLDRSSLELKGYGLTSCIKAVAGYGGPILLHGMSRRPAGVSLTTDHLVDLFGKLDSSAASAANQRWGYRIKDVGGAFDTVIATGPSPFSFGPCAYQAIPGFWATTPSFTIDFVIDWTTVGTHDGPYFGMVRSGASPDAMPWYVYGFLNLGNNTAGFRFYFRTANGKYDEGVNGGDMWQATFSVPATQAVQRVGIGLDLPNRLVLAYSGDAATGTQVATTVTPVFGNPLPSFAGASNLALCANTSYPFQMGPVNGTAAYNGSRLFNWTGSHERFFYGLRITTGLWFKNLGVGQPIQRADNGVLNDVNRYFNAPAGTIAYFPMQDSPAAVVANRVLHIHSGDAAAQGDTVAIFFDGNTNDDFAALSSLRINDVEVLGNNSIYSESLVLGRSLDVVIKESGLIAGGNGLSSWNAGANYTVKIVGGRLGGGNAGIYAFDAIVDVDGTNFVTQGRSAIWMNSSQFTGHNLFLPDGNPGVTEFVARAVGGSSIILTNLNSDTEGFVPKYGQIYAETGGVDVPPCVRLVDCTFAGNAYDMPLVVLHDATGIPGWLDWSGPAPLLTYYSSLVQTDGAAWQGTVNLPHAIDAPPITNLGLNGIGGIRTVSNQYIAPPRSTAWNRGNHVLEVPEQADGQFGVWRCTGTGEYGTATPPAWTGSAAADEGTNGLAAYLTGHTYWSGGSGTQRGFWTDYAQATVLNLLLTNAGTPAAPSSLYLGLSDVRAQRYPGRYRELTTQNSPGYARVATPPSSWVASSGGVSSNAATITLPTPTADWSPYQTVLLADALTGGNGIALIQVAPSSAPIIAHSGSAVSFAPGTLIVRPTTHTATRRQAFAPTIEDSINNYWLRAGTLTTPTLYLALSTAPADPTAGPTEPVGNGYARLAIDPATVFPELALYVSRQPDPMLCKLRNAIRLTFPTPTGSWNIIQSAYLMTALTGGSRIATGDLTIPRNITSGSIAPSFAPGSLWIGRS